MNETLICKPSPVKILAVTAAPLRELRNFFLYKQHPELLNERVRRQPALSFGELPSIIWETGKILNAEKCDRKFKFPTAF